MQSDYIVPGACLSQWEYIVHISRYAFVSQYARGKTILDIGCGTGYGASILKHNGARQVIGGDISDEALSIARQYYNHSNCEFAKIDAEDLPFKDDSFDMISTNCRRILKPHGLLFCSVMHREFITPFAFRKPFDQYHVMEYTPLELETLVAKYFNDVKIYGFMYGSRLWWQMRALANHMCVRVGMGKQTAHRIGMEASKKFESVIYSEIISIGYRFKKRIMISPSRSWWWE